MKRAAKRAALAGGLVITGAFAFVYIGLDRIVKNTGKPPRKPRKS